MADAPRPMRPLPSTPATDSDEGLRAGLVTRTIIVLTIVLGQLWALTVGLDVYLLGRTGQAWLLAGFSVLSFIVALVLVRLDPPPRTRQRPARTPPATPPGARVGESGGGDREETRT